ncbi:MAG: hypothetical protein AAGE43_01000 [Pseudomonadota bacterium]
MRATIPPTTTATRRLATRATLVTIALVLAASGSAGTVQLDAAAMATEPSWYLLEITGARPPCQNVEAGTRCVGTQPRIARFEMRDGERIEFRGGAAVPPAWTTFNEFLVYAPAAAGSTLSRSIELAATPLGARVIIEDGTRQYLKSVPLNRWEKLESGALGGADFDRLWVRVIPQAR